MTLTPTRSSSRQWITQLRPSLVEAEEQEESILAQASTLLERRLLRQGSLTDPTSAVEFLKVRLGGCPRELFFAIYLDTRHRILAGEVLFSGSIDSAEVHPRELARRALQLNAAAIICAHNHPSGDCEPSDADRRVTARLKQALALIEVRLLDHFIVSGTSYTSLAARGWV